MAAPTRSNAGSDKLPYSPPRLTIHGNLQTITAAKGGNRTDGGEPKTFNVIDEVASGFKWRTGQCRPFPGVRLREAGNERHLRLLECDRCSR